jgi:hypothetical protein
VSAAAMTVLTLGAQQLAIASAQVALWLVPVALAVLLLGLRWCARRRSRVPLQPLPPAHEDTQPMDPGEVTDGAPQFFERLPVIDGDELAKLRRSRRYEDDTFIGDGITRALRQILKEGDEG